MAYFPEQNEWALHFESFRFLDATTEWSVGTVGEMYLPRGISFRITGVHIPVDVSQGSGTLQFIFDSTDIIVSRSTGSTYTVNLSGAGLRTTPTNEDKKIEFYISSVGIPPHPKGLRLNLAYAIKTGIL